MSALDKIRKRLELLKQNEQSRPLRSLSATEKTREKRIRRLIERLDQGRDISRRDLKTALTEDEWQHYLSLEDNALVIKDAEKRPREFDRYIELLHKADFFHNRAASMRDKPKSRLDDYGRTPRAAMFSRAEGAYEDALEELQDLLISADQSYRIELIGWLDREPDFNAGSMIGADPKSIPRLRSSKSVNAQAGISKTNLFEQRRSNKRDALDAALSSLIFDIDGDQKPNRFHNDLMKFINDEDE